MNDVPQTDVRGGIYAFEFQAPYRAPLWLLGVRPATAWARLTDTDLDVRFGPWRVRTPLSNVADLRLTGRTSAVKTIGTRISLADSGLTFGSSSQGGVCVRFRVPVPGADPLGLLRHPGLTITIQHGHEFARRVRQHVEARRDPVTGAETPERDARRDQR